jgi:hypothetical protein
MIFILLYQCLAGLLAWWNYILIKDGKRIYHALNGFLHICAAVLIGYFYGWNYGVSCLLFTRVVFDTVLNVFRAKGVGYVSPHPVSKIDRIEKLFVLFVSEIVYRKKVFITEENIQWIAIGVRCFILLTAVTILFI